MAKSKSDIAEDLFKAAESDDLNTVKSCVERLKDGINTLNEENSNTTILVTAAGKGCDTVVKWLLDNGADVNYVDDNVDTALYVAAADGHLSTTHLLLSYGARNSFRSNDGDNSYSASAAAQSNKHDDVVKLINVAEKVRGLQEWSLLGQTCVVRSQASISLQRKLTETFNFFTRMYTSAEACLSKDTEITTTSLSLDALPRTSVEEAYKHFTELGGKANKAFVIDGKMPLGDKVVTLPAQKKKPSKTA